VEFLEKINYDDKTRSIQSYREQHMQQELSKLREALRGRLNPRELELQREVESARHQRDSAEENFRSMKSLVGVLQGKIQRLEGELAGERKVSRERILNSQEYYDLKEKYKRFLDQYKEIRAQNWNLKCIVDEKEAELQLSDSDPEPN
jgi:TolA-binding protein